jgi:hypothetical protein
MWRAGFWKRRKPVASKRQVNRQDHDEAAFRSLITAVSATDEVVLQFESRKTAESIRSNYYHWRKFMQNTGEPDCGAGIILRVEDDGKLVFTTKTVKPLLREALAAAGVQVRQNSDEERPRAARSGKQVPTIKDSELVTVPAQTTSNFSAALAASGLVRKPEATEDKDGSK